MGKIERVENILGVRVPIKVHIEHRRTVRISMGKKHVHLRLPIYLSDSDKYHQYKRAVQWIEQKGKSTPGLLKKYIKRTYKTGDQLHIYDQIFTINKTIENRATGRVSCENDTIQLIVPSKLSENDQNDLTTKLIAKICGKIFQPKIAKRVIELNQTYFQEEIKSIKLKYNQSNWGSCSTNKNINISSRLLFAPQKVIDYVIIHELAHLKEMNHSERFWNIVHSIMPDYKSKEKWLKDNGHLCSF